MTEEVEAVYENGVLRPLTPLDLAEHQRVTVTIAGPPPSTGRTKLDVKCIERARAEVAAMGRVPSLEEIRQRLSKIPGSMIGDFSAEREDR